MKKIKRILSMVLVCVMVLALVPVTTLTVSAAATGTTALFNGNATYLLQERFNETFTLDNKGNKVLSGWDVDYRGGKIESYGQPTVVYNDGGEKSSDVLEDYAIDKGISIIDSNTYEKVTMSRQLMKHNLADGNLVMESTFKYKTPVDDGFYYEMSGDGTTALKVTVERKSVGSTSCVFAVNGTTTNISCDRDITYHLKAEFSGSNVTVYINGEEVDTFTHSASSINKIEIGTGEAMIGKIVVSNVFVYVNYTVNESFLGNATAGWDVVNGEVVQVPGAPYGADPNGFALNSVEAVEPTYEIDAPRIFIKADKAAEYTMKGSNITVTDESQTIGGRKDIIKAAGVKNTNEYQVGVKLPDGFSFETDDVITYSFDIYVEDGILKPDVYIRDHKDYNPMLISYHGTISTGTWTTITKTITYADLKKEEKNGHLFTQDGNYAVYIRPRTDDTDSTDDDPLQNIYVDDFTVKIAKASDKYYTNAATGERLNYEMALDRWQNNVVYAANMDPIQYVNDPAGEKAGKVLMTGHKSTSLDHSSVIAIKLTNNFGEALGGLKIGDVIDISLDVYSPTEIADASTATTRGVMVRQSSSIITNGATGPTGYECRVAPAKKIPANDWTTLSGTGVVTKSDVNGRTLDDYIYVTVRLPYADVLYLSDLKLSIKNPAYAFIPSIVKTVEKKADFSYEGANVTVTDGDSIGGRTGVIHATGMGDSHGGSLGLSIAGSSFAFAENDILTYSFDIYSPTAAKPYINVRNHSDLGAGAIFAGYHTIEAGKWTTIRKTFTYDQMVAALTNGTVTGFKPITTAGDYHVNIRPNSGSDFYIDNFKVSVLKADNSKYFSNIATGERYVTTYPLDGLDTAVKYGKNMSGIDYVADDEKGTVLESTINTAGANGIIGFKIMDTYGLPVKALKTGEILDVSMDIKSSVAQNTSGNDTNGIMLRPAGDTTVSATDITGSPNPKVGDIVLDANQWKTVKASYAVTSDLTPTTGSSNIWYVTVRLPQVGDISIDNVKISVRDPKYAFGEFSNASLKKNFDELSGSQTFSFDVLVPTGGANGFKATLGGATFKIDGGKFYLNSTEVYKPTENVWYRIKVVTNGATASVSVNGDEKESGIAASGEMTSVAFENTSGKQIMIDNVQVAPTFDPSAYTDYPQIDEVATANNGLSIGMVSYPMWREGIHYGWDLITPYENRTPYLGYYTGGSQEVADWNLKWWAEHGFDHVIYPFVRPNINEAGGQPSFSVRGEELHDGYMNAINNVYVDFAIMLSNPLEGQFTDADEYIENVIPYIVEHYFRNPNYKRDGDNAVVYGYNLDEFSKCLSVDLVYNATTGKKEEVKNGKDGDAELRKILVALNTAAINAGYSGGVTFIADDSSNDSDYLDVFINNSPTSKFYRWRYTWRTDVASSVTQGLKNEYSTTNNFVTSIPMGFESTPWKKSDIGIMSATDIATMCGAISSRDANDPNFVIFTCWDEWGEGHWYAPSNETKFDYLNAVRKTLTDKANDLNSDVPGENAVKRMSVLYPEGRQILKIRKDPKIYDAALFTGEKLTTITPNYSSFGYASGTNKDSSLIILEYKTYEITNAKQASVTFKTGNVHDFSKVTAIKVKGYAQNSATMTINLGIGGSDEGYDTIFRDDNAFRFSCKNNPTGGEDEYILTPDDPDALVAEENAEDITNINYIRFNPAAATSVGSEFKVSEITVYTQELPGTKVYVDDKKYELVSDVKTSGNTTLIPAYKFLHDVGAMVKWDKGTGTLTAEKDGVIAKFTKNSTTVNVENGEAITLSTAAIYEAGNLFVPYDALLAPFGYRVDTSEAEKIKYYSKSFDTPTSTGYRWDFNKDGDTEGWSLTASAEPVLFTQGNYQVTKDNSGNIIKDANGNPVAALSGGGYGATVRDGVMHLRSNAGDPQIWLYNTSISDVNYATIRLKKSVQTKNTTGLLRLYDDAMIAKQSDGTLSAELRNLANRGVVYKYNVVQSDEFTDIVIDLSTPFTDTVNHLNTFETLIGPITRVRIDILDAGDTYGSVLIDSIQFTKNHPNPFAVKAYSFMNNLISDSKIAYWQYSGVKDYEGNKGGFGKYPDLADDGSYIIKPEDGKKTGLAGITRLSYADYQEDTEKDLGSYIMGKCVKVSFDYKGIGDCTSFAFENRDTDIPAEGDDRRDNELHLDGESFEGKTTGEWQHFEASFKVDEINDGRRWFAIRANRESTNGNGALLVKDWQIRVLDEVTEVDYLTEGGIAIRVIDNTGKGAAATTKVHVGAFNTAEKELTGFDSGSTIDPADNSTKHYYLAPTDRADELRTYIWNGFEPLTQPYVFTRNAQ